MGICWSEPPSHPSTGPLPHVGQSHSPMYPEKVVATAPPYQYQPPMTQYPPQYNPQYNYAVKPGEQVYYQYPQQNAQQYTYAYQYPQQYPPQQRQVSPVTAFVGGLVMGAIVEDILDPTE